MKHKKYGKKLLAFFLALTMVLSTPAVALADELDDSSRSNTTVENVVEEPASETTEADVPETVTIEPQTEEPQTVDTKTEEPQTADTKTEEPQTTDTKVEEPQTTDTKTEEPQTADTKVEDLQVMDPKTEEPAAETPEAEAPAAEEDRTESPAEKVPEAENPEDEGEQESPEEILEAESVIVNEVVTDATEKELTRALPGQNLTPGSVTKNIGDTGFYYRLPRLIDTCNTCGNVLREFVPDPDAYSNWNWSDSAGILTGEFKVSSWPEADEYHDLPCLEFDYTAVKYGITTVTLTFEYEFDAPWEEGYCDNYYCGAHVVCPANYNTYQDTVTFQVIVRPQAPQKDDVNALGDMVTVDCVNAYADHESKSYGLLDGGYRIGSVTMSGNTFYSTLTVLPAAYVTKYNADLSAVHKLSPANQGAKRIDLQYDTDTQKWILASGATIPVTYKVDCNQYKYSLKYDANGGDGAPADDTYGPTTDTSHTFIVSTTEPTRDGYKFLGWADTSTATAAGYLRGDEITLTGSSPEKTIYAVWEKNPETYTVTYTDGVEGEVIFEDEVHAGLQYGIATPEFNNGTLPEREDYIFKGWNPEVSELVTGNATYTATWEEDKLDWNGLTIHKSVDKTEAKPGDTVTYTITVSNKTGKDLENIKVSEKLDDNLNFVSADQEDQYNVDKGVWTIPSLANDGEVSLTIIATVKDGVADQTVIGNKASITDAEDSDGNHLPDDNKPENSANVTVDNSTTQPEDGRVVLNIYKNGDTKNPAVENAVIGTYPVGTDMREIAKEIDLDDYYTPHKAAAGYEFDGVWYKDGSVLVWKLDESSKVIKSQWNRITCMVYDIFNVNYHIDGETVHSDQITEKTRQDYALYTAPEKEGYTFDGWYEKAADIGNASKKVTVPLGLKKYELYGAYTANPYKVTFDPQGGECDPTSEYVVFDTPYGDLPVPTRDGYEFTGWTLDKEGTQPVDADTIVKTPSDHTLYAQWEKLETVQLVIYRNGDTTKPYKTVSLQKVKKGTDLDLTSAEYQISKYYNSQWGYEFEGWYNDGGWNNYKAGNKNTTLGETLTVNGWTNIICMVTDKYPVKLVIYRNGDTTKPYQTYDMGLMLKGETLTIDYDINDYYTNDPDKFLFDGWFNDGRWNEYKAGKEVSGLTELVINGWTNVIGMVTDYTDPTPLDPIMAAYRVEHYLEQQDGTYELEETQFPLYGELDSEVTAEANAYAGYTEDTAHADRVASGKVTKPVVENGEVQVLTLKLYYNLNRYEIVYHGNGGVLTSNPEKDQTTSTWKYNQEVTLKNAKTFTRENYTFMGWALAADKEVSYQGGQKGLYNLTGENGEKVHLYAVWTPNVTPVEPKAAVYKVEHYKEQPDGTYTLAEVQFPLYGELGATVTAQSKVYENYTENTAHADRVASGTVTMPELAEGAQEPSVLTLKLYYDLNSHTVTFESGAHGKLNNTEQTVSGTHKHGAAYPGAPVVTADTDYVFDGWYAGEQKVTAFPATVTADAVYTAKYKDDKNNNGIADETETKYTVTYTDGVDGEEIFKDQVYDNLLSGSNTPAYAGNPERDGYTFKGWDPAVSETVTGDVVYKAVWDKKDDDKKDDDKKDDGKKHHHSSKSDSDDTSSSAPAAGDVQQASPLAPQTGDNSPIVPLLLLSMLSMAGIAAVVFDRKKNKCRGREKN